MKKIILTLLLLFSVASVSAHSTSAPVGFLNDYVGLLSESEAKALEIKLANFEATSSNEIVVVIIPELDRETIELFAVEQFQEWGIGKEKQDNGVLLAISVKDRAVRIEVGYGLEGALTDIQSKAIIDSEIVPAFRAGNYYAGIDRAVDKIILATKGEYVPEAPVSQGGDFLPFGFVVLFLGLMAINRLFSSAKKKKPWWAAGVWGAIVGLFFGVISSVMGVVVLFIVFSLVIDILLGIKGGGGFWMGGGGFGRGGSGGGRGFGGFGGGSSGGGGASGRW